MKTLGGFQPVPVTHVQTEQPGTLGPFWTEEYIDAYAELQRLLAARYDDNPLVRDNAISGCMTVFAEPFQRDLTNFDSRIWRTLGLLFLPGRLTLAYLGGQRARYVPPMRRFAWKREPRACRWAKVLSA